MINSMKNFFFNFQFAIQLAGSYSDTFTKACQLISENCQVDFVDVNFGCPIDLVFNKGAGSALA